MKNPNPDALLAHFRNILSEYCGLQRGRQSELARMFDCDRATITDWLNDTTPSGDKVLAILAWLPASVRRAVFQKPKR